MSVKTRKEIRDDEDRLIGVVEWDENTDAVVSVGIGPDADALLAQLDTADMVDLFTALGEAARFLGLDPERFFAPDDAPEEPE